MCRVEDQLKFPTSSYTLDAVSCRDNLNSTKLDFCREGGRKGGRAESALLSASIGGAHKAILHGPNAAQKSRSRVAVPPLLLPLISELTEKELN